jgi:hypothetical protein
MSGVLTRQPLPEPSCTSRLAEPIRSVRLLAGTEIERQNYGSRHGKVAIKNLVPRDEHHCATLADHYVSLPRIGPAAEDMNSNRAMKIRTAAIGALLLTLVGTAAIADPAYAATRLGGIDMQAACNVPGPGTPRQGRHQHRLRLEPRHLLQLHRPTAIPTPGAATYSACSGGGPNLLASRSPRINAAAATTESSSPNHRWQEIESGDRRPSTRELGRPGGQGTPDRVEAGSVRPVLSPPSAWDSEPHESGLEPRRTTREGKPIDMGYEEPECKRCYQPVQRCDVCKGEKRVQFMFGDCTECDGTGWVCEKDGKHWRG